MLPPVKKSSVQNKSSLASNSSRAQKNANKHKAINKLEKNSEGPHLYKSTSTSKT
jgi:hypothetical protein